MGRGVDESQPKYVSVRDFADPGIPEETWICYLLKKLLELVCCKDSALKFCNTP